jgi:hypothetical protein
MPSFTTLSISGQKWRTGSEGRISVVKQRHRLNRSRYKGDPGMKRWVGLGVIADNLVNISRIMAKHHTLPPGTCRRVRKPQSSARPAFARDSQ